MWYNFPSVFATLWRPDPWRRWAERGERSLVGEQEAQGDPSSTGQFHLFSLDVSVPFSPLDLFLSSSPCCEIKRIRMASRGKHITQWCSSTTRDRLQMHRHWLIVESIHCRSFFIVVFFTVRKIWTIHPSFSEHKDWKQENCLLRNIPQKSQII